MVTVTKNRNSVVSAECYTHMYESVIAYGEKLDWNYWRLIYICVMSGTSIIIDLFHQPLFLIIYLLQCFTISLVHNLYDFYNNHLYIIYVICMQPMQPKLQHQFFFTAIFHFLFLSHQLIITWLNRWKPGFVALRRFLFY